jgi:hypothetical protein
MKELTMEQMFIITYLCTILSGIGLGILTYWLFERGNKNG